MKSIFTKEQINFMKENYRQMSYREIGDILGFTERQIRSKINGMKLKKNREFNKDYFENIDTPIKSYFLGFIFADGYLVCNEKSSNYELGFELSSVDKYILERLNAELGNLHNIYHTDAYEDDICGIKSMHHDMDCLRIYSKKVVYDLINNGIMPNKTKLDIYPIVKDNLFFDFLRGYIDGDGCFYKIKNNVVNMHITCASDIILNYIKDKLLSYGIKTSIYKEKDRKYRLMCTNIQDMKLLVNRLYYTDDLFCLKRKYEKVKHLLNGFAA